MIIRVELLWLLAICAICVLIAMLMFLGVLLWRRRRRRIVPEARSRERELKRRRKRMLKRLRRPLKTRIADCIASRGTWTRAWLRRDIANVLVFDSETQLVRFLKTSHSRMEKRHPDFRESSCWIPRETALVRVTWLIGMPIIMAIVVWLAGYMIILGWEGWRWTPTVAAIAQIPISLRLGYAAGYRAMPKPVWLLRVQSDGEVAFLNYDEEWVEGTMGPRHVYTTSRKVDIRDMLSGSTRDWKPGILPTSGVITGISVCAIVLFLVFTTGRNEDPAQAAGTASPTPIVEVYDRRPLPAFEGTVAEISSTPETSPLLSSEDAEKVESGKR